MHKYVAIFPFILCLLLSGCGKGYKDPVFVNDVIADGQYHAKLMPLNKHLGKSNGYASISIRDNQFWARVKIFGPQTHSIHPQYIHDLDRCPGPEDDTNRDGIVDIQEVISISGPMLIPLDSDLSSQLKGLNEFPHMMRFNFYYYSEACHSDRLFRDLKAQDELHFDFMSKLHKGEKINLSSRVIVIYGIAESRPLPSSVRSQGGLPAQLAVPIACGRILEGESSEFSQGVDFPL